MAIRRALASCERLDDNGPIRGRQSAEVIGISRLHDASAGLDRNGDGMGVREERGTGTRLA